MIFETERLSVRQWNKKDLPGLHELYSDTAIMEFIHPALTIDETKKIFQDQLAEYKDDNPFGRFLIIDKLSNSFTGIFMLRKPDSLEGVEIGYSFRKQDWGKGFATEIVKKSITYIFQSDMHNIIYAFTHLQNANSKKVLLKCGFTQRKSVIENGEKTTVFYLNKNKQPN